MIDTSNFSLDVVICTYNNHALLEQTLTTLAQQQTPAGTTWRLTVIDNNCTDNTAAVVERFRNQIPGLRRVEEPRQGLTYARLCAIHSTTADWIAFIDDDNLVAPDYVANAIHFARSHPNCGAFGAQVTLQINPYVSFPRKLQPLTVATQDWGPQEFCLPDSGLVHLIGAGLTLRRAAICQSGWLDTQFLVDRQGNQLSSGGDIEIVLLIRKAGYELWYNPACKIRHIVPDQRATPTYLKRIAQGNAAAMTVISGMCPNREPFWWWFIVKLGAIAAFSLLAVVGRLRITATHAERLYYISLWNEALGRLAGLWTVLKMPSELRKQWFTAGKP